MMGNAILAPGSVPWANFGLDLIPDPAAKPLTYLLTAFFLITALYTLGRKSKSDNITHLNPRKPFEFSDSRAKDQFNRQARDLLASWFCTNPDRPARVIADVGRVTVLPARYINELKSHPDLSFSKWIFNAFHATLPGFEGFREGSRDSNIVQRVIMKDLTKHLNKVTEPLSEETNLALEEVYPGSPDNGKSNNLTHTHTHTKKKKRREKKRKKTETNNKNQNGLPPHSAHPSSA